MAMSEVKCRSCGSGRYEVVGPVDVTSTFDAYKKVAMDVECLDCGARQTLGPFKEDGSPAGRTDKATP